MALGQSAIPDSVARFASFRRQWHDLADRHQASWCPIESVCSDNTVHRQRLGRRQRGLTGWRELTWDDAERVGSYYEPWTEPRLALEATRSLVANIEEAVIFVWQNGRL